MKSERGAKYEKRSVCYRRGRYVSSHLLRYDLGNNGVCVGAYWFPDLSLLPDALAHSHHQKRVKARKRFFLLYQAFSSDLCRHADPPAEAPI